MTPAPALPWCSVWPNRASSTALITARMNPAMATPASPCLVLSPSSRIPTAAGGTVSTRTTAATATVTLPPSRAEA